MLDDLRDDANMGDELFEDEDEDVSFDDFEKLDDDFENLNARSRRKNQRKSLLGVTPLQRFVLAGWLFALSCILSFMCLLVTGTIVI
jgi:hypothetical protein